MKLFRHLKLLLFRCNTHTRLIVWVCLFFFPFPMQIFAEKEVIIPAIAQGRTVQGIVTDDSGEPLPGVTIVVKGTTAGVTTGSEGSYSINVPDNAILVFSFVGFATQEVPVGNQTQINISLRESAREIEEVVVIGYGTVRKSDLTGSVISVSTKQFKDQPVKLIQEVLQGRTAGVEVTQTTGMIGQGARVRIRGTTSINKSSDPLYIVDGVPGGLMNLDDIQSIEILKDASATAIYGSRGANGVVLITTKKGEEGKPRITLETSLGVSNIMKRYDLLGAYEYAQLLNEMRGSNIISADDMEAYKNGTKGVDWQDMMTQTGYDQDYKLSISGGNAKTKYYISSSILDQTAVTITTKFNRYQFRAKMDTEVTPWFKIGTNLNYGHSKMHNGSVDLLQMVNYSPTMEIKNEETGVYNNDPYNSLINNPYGNRIVNYNDNYNDNFSGMVDLQFNIIDGLTLSVIGNLGFSSGRSFAFTSQLARPGAQSSMNNQTNSGFSWVNINNLTYQKKFGDHQITATAAFEMSKDESTMVRVEGTNLANEIVSYWNVGNAATRTPSNSYSGGSMASGIFRLMYNYKNRYFLTGTYRADGSSKFLGDNKWGYFPSGAIAWDVAKEDFFSDQTIFQQLKVRTSYGVTGNQDIERYSTLGMLSTNQYAWGRSTGYTGYWGNTFATPDVTWEKTAQYDIGLDFSVLNRRLNASIDWYVKKTTDLLFQKTIPRYNGGGTIWVNQGEVKNTGFDITLDATPVSRNNFMWESVLTTGYVKNEVVDLAGQELIYGPNWSDYGGVMTIMQLGYPVGTFYMYLWDGFDDEGANLYRTIDGSLSTRPSSNDQVITNKHGMPNWTLGWNNMVSWKNWTANIFINAAQGAHRLNITRFNTATISGGYRFFTLRDAYYKGWDYVSNKADAEYPTFGGANRHLANSDFWLENASFLKIKNISIAYTIPRNVLKYLEAQLSFSVQNVYTFTKYKGMDPEVFSSENGIDSGSYPIPRTFTFGLKINY